jgi:hypothetical protein
MPNWRNKSVSKNYKSKLGYNKLQLARDILHQLGSINQPSWRIYCVLKQKYQIGRL